MIELRLALISYQDYHVLPTYRAATGPHFVPGLPRVTIIELRLVLISYQDYHVCCCATPAGPTTNGAACIKTWVGAEKWDVITVNFGIHDCCPPKENVTQARAENRVSCLCGARSFKRQRSTPGHAIYRCGMST